MTKRIKDSREVALFIAREHSFLRVARKSLDTRVHISAPARARVVTKDSEIAQNCVQVPGMEKCKVANYSATKHAHRLASRLVVEARERRHAHERLTWPHSHCCRPLERGPNGIEALRSRIMFETCEAPERVRNVLRIALALRNSSGEIRSEDIHRFA